MSEAEALAKTLGESPQLEKKHETWLQLSKPPFASSVRNRNGPRVLETSGRAKQ